MNHCIIFLKNISEDIELIQDTDKLPELSEMNGQDKNEGKLIIFDDIINLSKKELLKIQKWFNSAGAKLGTITNSN